jgi:hypothetical protein
MKFRSRKSRGERTGLLRRRSGATADADPQTIEALSEEIDDLSRANRTARDPEISRRILRLRHRAGLALIERPPAETPEYAASAPDQLSSDRGLPEVAPGEVTPELLRAAILRSGCLLIRGALDEDRATRLVAEIDRAYEARDAQASGGSADNGYFEEFEPDPRFDLAFDRGIVGSGGGSGLWVADSPQVMFDVLDEFERAGLRRLATDYLGERPAISVNKCLLRKVSPELFERSAGSGGSKPSAWHQDGAFLGDVRALNVWLSLSRCGDEAPGLDIVPQRMDGLVPTGTRGAVYDWSVSHEVAEEAAGEVGVLRPIFEPGDVLLFDELLLHATAAEPEMPNMRYAVESWFFGASGFPREYAPLAF